MNITIPSLNLKEMIEDWQPLFTASTSSLTAHAGDANYIIIRSRDKSVWDAALISIQEETIEAALKILRNNLDPPIDITFVQYDLR